MNRKHFLQKGLVATGGLLIVTNSALSQETTDIFEIEDIYEFVLAAHRNLDDVKKIYEATPLILNCTNQSKKGDFETAMGGAAHMGRKDIADYLLSKGARLNIFSMTYLGYTDAVKQILKAQPDLINAPGPHGFSLLHHAKVGKHTKMMEWLKKKGLETTHFKGAFG